jgi:hypothetical protein
VKEVNMISEQLKTQARQVKKLEQAQIALGDLWAAAKNYLDAKNGKADEFVPEDIWEDNLRDALRGTKKHINKEF